MLEQQLVDYIKKAKEAGQSEEQTRALLYKNGWTEIEVGEAFTSINQPQAGAQVQPQVSVQPKSQQQPEFQERPQQQTQQQPKETQISGRPEIRTQAQPVNQPESHPVQPQAQPQYKPQSPAMNMQPQHETTPAKKSHLGLKLLMVLIILVVLGGVGYFVAGQYINLLWNPFAPSPETVVSKMFANMANINSSQTKTQIEVGVTDSNGEPQGKLSIGLNGGSDLADASNAKVNMTLTTDFSLPGSVGDVASANVDVVGLGSTLYFKLSNVSVPSDYSSLDFDLSQMSGKWFKLDQDSINILSQASSSNVPSIDASQIGSSVAVNKIRNILSTENLFSNYQQLSDEVGAPSGLDQATYHYLATVSKDKLYDLLNKIIASAMPAESQDGSSPLAQNMAGAFVKTFTDAVGDINVEMWIGKKDYLLYQVKINKAVDLNKISQGINMKVVINFSEVNSDFNKPALIQEPKDAQKVEDILLPIIKMQGISSDIGQIGFIAQSVFDADQSYSSLCTRGLLNGYLADYGESLITLNNDIVDRGASKPACFAGVQDYCVSTQLSGVDYLCVGSGGVSGKTKCVSSTTACK